MTTPARQPDDIPRIIAELKELLEPADVFAVRTYYRTTSDGASRRHLVLHFPEESERHLILSPREKLRQLAVERLEKFTGLSGANAARVLELGHALSELNHLGGWSFKPQREITEATTMDRFQIAGRDYTTYTHLSEPFDDIGRLLKGKVARIEMVNIKGATTEKGRKGMRWAAWQYFYDANGIQIAAHQQHLMNLLASQYVGQDDSARDTSDHVLRGLGNQLGLPPDAVVMLNIYLSNAQQKFGINHVVLEEEG